jgi:drug/metabolite transporter (DMT)-like permease
MLSGVTIQLSAARTRTAIASGALAATIVGGTVPISGLLDAYPMISGQAVRYTLGGLILLAWARGRRRPLPRPSLTDVRSLIALAAIGMLGFNACIILAQRYAEPGFVAALLGGSPLVLAIIGPLLAGRRPSPLTIAGATIVVLGIAVLSGGGSWHGPGLLLAILTMLCEASFTLLAVGVVGRLGAFAAATWCCFTAAVAGALVATCVDGASAWRLPAPKETFAILSLAIGATAIGFCCWYRAVNELGSDRAGVLIGLMPISGFLVSVAIGAQPLVLASCGGAILVTAGCILGLRRTEPRPNSASVAEDVGTP